MKAQFRAIELLMRIKLRLNPNEKPHNDLIAALQKLSEASPDPAPDEDSEKLFKEFAVARGNVLSITQEILKSEWIRVRKGE